MTDTLRAFVERDTSGFGYCWWVESPVPMREAVNGWESTREDAGMQPARHWTHSVTPSAR